ncbi:hypothetical protein ElyMa_003513200 [Elysia marginata]|uniref:Zasp-like motif domain-containing protein n=1 Tax=Elysia marginata TaxID=1093978 RepID=A0AAV4EG63_9GAST|nr:hypothetical protein ElyMa_003513200 [Elysia marginata]
MAEDKQPCNNNNSNKTKTIRDANRKAGEMNGMLLVPPSTTFTLDTVQATEKQIVEHSGPKQALLPHVVTPAVTRIDRPVVTSQPLRTPLYQSFTGHGSAASQRSRLLNSSSPRGVELPTV